MKSSNVQYVGFLLVILTMFYVLSKVEVSSNATATDNLFTIKQADVNRIRVSSHDEIMDVIRQDSVWVMVGMGDLPIDELAEFLNELFNAKRGTMVTDNPAQWATYGVDDSAGMHLELFDLDGVSAGHYVVGKSLIDTTGNYIRSQGTNEVYLASISIHNVLQKLTTIFE